MKNVLPCHPWRDYPKTNPWLCRETVCSPGECESKMYSNKAHLGNRAKLRPKTANSVTMSAIIPENKVVKSKKGKLALRTKILSTHREALSFRAAKFVATIWLKPSKIQFFHLFPINIRVFPLLAAKGSYRHKWMSLALLTNFHNWQMITSNKNYT